MTPIVPHPIRLADLPQGRPTERRLVPDAGQLEALAGRLAVDALRKVRLDATLTPGPGRDWTLAGRLGATVVQPCRVTMAPVTTRIEEPVGRRYAADWVEPEDEEAEMSGEDEVEALPATLDLGAVLEEALALAIPAFPRAEGADEIDLSAAPPGAAPLDDAAVRPFAGLAGLRAKMDGDGEVLTGESAGPPPGLALGDAPASIPRIERGRARGASAPQPRPEVSPWPSRRTRSRARAATCAARTTS